MHREEDFDAVVEVIGEELLGLGVDADAIGINLFDLQRQEKRQYVVTRFQPPYVDVESCDQPAVQTLMAYWRRQEVWERAPNEEFMLAVADVDAFAEDEPQSIVDVPFRHGTIAAGVPTPIGANAELIGLLQEIAGSVSLGYERALDLAARRAAEAQLQRSRQNERLVSERNRVFREKAAAASHELLNPLSIIRGNLELSLTRDHTLPPTVVTSLNLALRASGRVEAMVRAMATKQTFQTADYAGGRIADLRIPANGSEPT
jgi:signal transduction histidine kinase